MPTNRLLGAQEVADYLGVPLATLYAWRSKSKGPKGYRVGRHVKYRMSEVDFWLAEQADDREPAA